MLVVTRHEGEGVVIGGAIRVVFLEIRGDRGRFGVSAPGHIEVDRDEVFESKTGIKSAAVDGKECYLIDDSHLEKLVALLGDPTLVLYPKSEIVDLFRSVCKGEDGDQ